MLTLVHFSSLEYSLNDLIQNKKYMKGGINIRVQTWRNMKISNISKYSFILLYHLLSAYIIEFPANGLASGLLRCAEIAGRALILSMKDLMAGRSAPDQANGNCASAARRT